MYLREDVQSVVNQNKVLKHKENYAAITLIY